MATAVAVAPSEPQRVPALALSIQQHARFSGLPARSTLKRWIAAALERDAEVTLRFVDAREGRRLNLEFRGKDYSPDVLTFDYQTEPVVRADIVICVPAVAREARARRKSSSAHLAHLIVHATLHAHGYHHRNHRQAREMESRETQLLLALRRPDPYQ